MAIVLTRARSGLRTSDASPSSTTAPPIMMMGGRMASHRMDGGVRLFGTGCAATCVAAWVAKCERII